MGQPHFSLPLVHRVNLDAVGGVEVSFLQYAQFRRQQGLADTVVVGDSVHPRFTAALESPTRTVWRSSFKRWHGLRVPRGFHRLRARQAVRQIATTRAAAILAWNHLGNREIADIAHATELPLIHYEHGEAWRPEARHAEVFLSRVNGAIVNSYAAERILALRWGWRGVTERVYCTCDGVLPLDAVRASLPAPGRIRLGAAARMIELKGHRIALHTLKLLRDQHGLDATLDIAGTGEQEQALQAEARRLGLTDSVDFKGSVADMADFYDNIDVMLVPSMVEPFGRTSIEAQARGCPVVVSAVDGLPETLDAANTGAQVVPDWSLEEYSNELGGNVSSVLPWAYDPGRDELIRPRAVSPDRMAYAVCALVDDDKTYRDASLRGLRNTNAHYLPEWYGVAVDDAVKRLVNGA